MCCRSFVCRQTEEEEASGAKNEKRTKGGKKVALSIPPLPSSTTVKRQRIRFHSPTETCIIFLSSFFPFSSRLSHPPPSSFLPLFFRRLAWKKFDLGVFGCGPTPAAHKKCPRKKGKKGSLHFFVLHPSPLLLPRDASQSLDRSAVAVSRMSAAAACCQQESLSRLWPLWPA